MGTKPTTGDALICYHLHVRSLVENTFGVHKHAFPPTLTQTNSVTFVDEAYDSFTTHLDRDRR